MEFRAYLFRAGRNAKIDWLRRRAARGKVIDPGAEIPAESPRAVDNTDPIRALAMAELDEAIRQCLGGLSETQRESLLLSCEGLVRGEIAAVLGRAPGNVGRWVKEARRGMAECLEKKGVT